MHADGLATIVQPAREATAWSEQERNQLQTVDARIMKVKDEIRGINLFLLRLFVK